MSNQPANQPNSQPGRRPVLLAELLTSLGPWGVGFDRQFSVLEAMLGSQRSAFPPHNIRRTGEHSYVIELAVAGFSRDELLVSVEERSLKIDGAKRDTETDGFLHRGIAGRNFSQRIALAEYVEVRGASLADGILSVSLERVVPEEKQPRLIAIE